MDIGDDIRNLLIDIFSKQENFSKVRNVDKASVKLRFRIMTEVKAEGNILNRKKYPKIEEDTINLIVPNHSEAEEKLTLKRFSAIYDENDLKQFNVFKIKHHLNGYFTVFQQKVVIRKSASNTRFALCRYAPFAARCPFYLPSFFRKLGRYPQGNAYSVRRP